MLFCVDHHYSPIYVLKIAISSCSLYTVAILCTILISVLFIAVRIIERFEGGVETQKGHANIQAKTIEG